ncbi:sulfatase family protein [Seonamhaeicola marinus]|uniref:Sulfatase n=1 Tax=Seonamhaeicola marinus TaxID=1912246 RepID=A0A5D0IZ69_9FLAO|nr:sulfatase [Seonamhaeicola marinus]TYA89225.1 sulfatase [Seonamhaeicola marinus]
MKKIVIIITLVLCITGCKKHVENNAEINTKPNIIWLMAEDISTDLECYGTPAVKTPNLNKLASQGVKFENCFVTNPICSPSRSAMMLGVHQNKSNTHNHRSNREVPLDLTYKPLTYWLRNEGYTTIIGHHSVLKKGRKTDVNFKHSQIGPWDGKENFGLFDKYDTFEKEDQPFFAHIQLKATHRGDWWDKIRENSKHPVNPDEVVLPPYMADHPTVRLDWAKYLDQMEFIDDEVGMIVNELEEKGMAHNTIIIFIGDNGRCNIKGKGYLHDPGLHIPFIVYDPRDTGARGAINKQVISSTDITATVLDYAGVKIPDYVTGTPIFSKDFNRTYVFGARDLWDEVEEKSRAVTSGQWKYIKNYKPEIPYEAHQAYLEFYRPAVHVMRTLKLEGKLNEDESFFFNDKKPVEELYNLEQDPHELNNLANNSDYDIIKSTLQKELQQYEDAYAPISDTYNPVHPIAVDVLKWVKDEQPEEYQKMLSGIEIGWDKSIKGYKESLK